MMERTWPDGCGLVDLLVFDRKIDRDVCVCVCAFASAGCPQSGSTVPFRVSSKARPWFCAWLGCLGSSGSIGARWAGQPSCGAFGKARRVSRCVPNAVLGFGCREWVVLRDSGEGFEGLL